MKEWCKYRLLQWFVKNAYKNKKQINVNDLIKKCELKTDYNTTQKIIEKIIASNFVWIDMMNLTVTNS